MKERLLALLVAKFAGVDNAILERIAEKKVKGITDEGQLDNIADGVTFATVIQSEADRRATEASQTAHQKAISEYEKQHNLKDGKVITTPTPPPPVPPIPGNDVPEWMKKYMEDQNKIMSELTNTVKGVVTTQSLASKKASFKALFDKSKLPAKWFDTRIDWESETSIKDQISELVTEFDGYRQDIINENIEGGNLIPRGSGLNLDPNGIKDIFNEDSGSGGESVVDIKM